MRTRSIKPEFWRSDDIARLSWDDRLLFIGLWSYVDDNGVGRDEERIIAADLFALDASFSEASLRVHEGLMRLHAENLIERYEVDGRPYIHIVTWSKHQKINRPSPGRYPLPTVENSVIHDPLSEPSVKTHNTLSAGTGEQGNRGTVLKPPVVPLEGDATAEDDSSSKPSRRRTSKTLIPEGWHPSEHHVQTASERGIDLATETEKFKAYAESNAKRYANWDQAFNNWLLNASNFNRQQQGYVNKAQQRYEQNMQRIQAAEARAKEQPQLTQGGSDNDFGF